MTADENLAKVQIPTSHSFDEFSHIAFDDGMRKTLIHSVRHKSVTELSFITYKFAT